MVSATLGKTVAIPAQRASFDVAHFGVLRLDGAFLFHTALRKRSAGNRARYEPWGFHLTYGGPMKTRESGDKSPHSKETAQHQYRRVELLVIARVEILGEFCYGHFYRLS